METKLMICEHYIICDRRNFSYACYPHFHEQECDHGLCDSFYKCIPVTEAKSNGEK
jgi:hypothetical protein